MTAEELWAKARPYLEAALEHSNGTHHVDDLPPMFQNAELQLWVGERCVAVSEFLNFPRKRRLNVFLAGGDLSEMRAMRPGVEAFARANLCDGVMFSGRATEAVKRTSGWGRASGYEPTHVCFIKDFSA